MKSILLAHLFTLLYLNCHACICIKETDKFNLSVYDQSTNIIEVKVISEYKSKNTKKPKSLIDYGLQKGYNVRILEVFKGNLTVKDTIMGFSYNSSCTWTPKVNEQYIFYTDYLDGVNLCSKKLDKNLDPIKYKVEKNHL